MADESKEAFLHRWSRRKHEAEKETEQLPAAEEKLPPLPPVDKLTPESDFTGFMHPKVKDALRRAALKKLFNDTHFNIPDPFEPYSGDWNVGEPISDELLATLNQAKQHLFSDKKQEKEEGTGEAPEQQAEAETPKPDEPGRQDA